ncbi:hypothetical protein CON36_33130 [Bacillus cereus]|uniref:Uncharacterized protein n=2 Tax=Bacillus cereus group TaxID=86661 RepID=A0A9X6WLQ3_BACTU|nr:MULTISPECIES: hypothetical protein [Bacillus cereus group]PDZ94564.1 hypothetical protein CON36_33130 [Bacillus cereus]PFJ36710.1 hypothetical protein COJ15_22490 [Bacillus thuringiensis]
MLENTVVEKIVRKILVSQHLKEVETRFEYPVYVDYHDQVSESQLKEISQSEDKMECFYNALYDFASDLENNTRDALIDIIQRNWNTEEHGEFDLYSDSINDFIGEVVDIQFPYEHYLKQKICVNLLVDTGDGNHDYTLNNFASYNSSEDEEIEEESSILWLVKQQGYTKEQLLAAIKHSNYHNDSKLLKSVHTECVNVTSHMNALAFFVQMTLEDFIKFTDNSNSLVLSSNTSCGLYDLWNGAGGSLDISLEKDVEIPSELIRAHIDGMRGYGVSSVYGISTKFWRDTVISFK